MKKRFLVVLESLVKTKMNVLGGIKKGNFGAKNQVDCNLKNDMPLEV